ncbi:MAG: hypothetical protein VX436_01085 [Planctomycetota bacterium]|nr:hypothetical protein [Planctomycetota bacterium]
MGDFPFPPTGWGEGGNIIFKRLQAHHLDLEPSVSGGAEYFGEIQFISAHDSLFGNQFNNSTWQPISISGSGSNWTIALSGQDHVGEPALRAWGEQNSSVRITESRPINDGAILVGVLASPVVDGWYQYEYAIQNVNADRGVQQLEIQLPLGGKVLEIGFHGVAYHSDELVDDTEWTITNDSARLIWQTNTFEENPMSNAIRWGTTYNFRFISNVPPADGIIKLKPFHLNGVIKNEFINTRVPNLNIDPCGLAESQCPTDLTSDGAIDVADLLLLFDWWGDCGDGTYKPLGDANGDCCVNVQDMLAVIEDWGEECSNGEEGACCLEDGSCISSDSQADCELKAGIWNGLFTTCKTVSCANVGACCLNDGQCQPNTTIAECVNMNGGWFGIDSICTDITCGVGSDNCSDAPWVNAGLHFINTTTATTDGPNHTECETGGDAGVTGNDIWMTYQAETNGTLTVSTCEQVGGSADFDTDIVVYDGNDCNNLTLLDCDDDTPDFKCGSESGGYHSNVVVPVIQGTAYLIRVGGWQDGHYGTGSLLIEEK